MSSKDTFVKGLDELAYVVENPESGNRVTFSYQIADGRFKEQQIVIGIEVPGDFPLTPPSGPHISPKLIPINTEPTDNRRAAPSPFGDDWEYLSRPFVHGTDGWNRTAKTVKVYLRHVAWILETL